MRILIICAQSPWPPHGGAPLRSLGWLRTASQVAEIGLVSLIDGRVEERDTTALEAYCDFVRLVPVSRSKRRRVRDLLASLGTSTPYVVQASLSKRMARAVSAAIEQWQPDIVQAEWLGAASYLSVAKLRGLPTVYAAHNVEHQIGRGRAQTWPQLLTRLQAKSLLAVETAYARNADLVVTVTEEDKKWFQQLNKQVSCIPNAVHPAEYRFQSPSARAKGPVVFIGHLSYPPNLDAARELIGSIFPLLHQRLPDTHLVVAGKRPPRRLRRMTSSNVSVVGDVGDIRRIWEQAAALLSPLRNGGGSRLKLLEAAACGVPIIATGFSARGSSLQPGRDFLAVEDPAGMAAACEALLRQPGRWDGTAVQARKTIEQHHNWENLTDRLRQIYESLAHHHR